MSSFDSLYSSAYSLFSNTFASPVTYRRGEYSVIISDAYDGDISNSEQVEFGANIIKEGMTFQILKASLIINSILVEPATGDVLEDSDGNYWEVCSFGNLPDYEEDENKNYWKVRAAKSYLGS